MQAVQTQIYTILASDSALQTLLGGTGSDKKIYPSISDKFELFPCIVYEEVAATFRTRPLHAQDIVMQFTIYSKTNHKNVEDIFTRLNFLLNYYSDTNPQIVYIRQSNAVDQNDTSRRLFAKAIRYNIWSLDM